MALFERQHTPATRKFVTSDAADALSVADVGGDFVENVYQKLAGVYDYAFGPTLHPGRLEAIEKMDLRAGEGVLEVGVGTGINLSLYPRTCTITGIDLSSRMLAKAERRIVQKDLDNCRLREMNAEAMDFPADSFDVVYASYVISVVPDPVKVAREMYRVCRPGGRVIILNHFKSANCLMSRIERAISPFTVHIGFRADVDLGEFLRQADLQPVTIEKVNIPKMWSLVTTIKK